MPMLSPCFSSPYPALQQPKEATPNDRRQALLAYLTWVLSALYPFFIWELFLSPQHHVPPSTLSTAMGMWPNQKTWFSSTRGKRVSPLSFLVEAVRAAISHLSDPFTTREHEANMQRAPESPQKPASALNIPSMTVNRCFSYLELGRGRCVNSSFPQQT